MTIFWGLDPDAMQELAEKILEEAERLRELFEILRDRTATVAWEGPDAEDHRSRFAEVDSDLLAVCRALDDRGAQLRDEIAEQERASAAGGARDPLEDVRADFPPRGSGGAIPSLGDPDLWDPELGGPFAHRDPAGLARDAEAWFEQLEEEHGPFGPMIGGPFAAPFDPAAVPVAYGPGELPEGEPFAPDQGRLDDAAAERELWLGKIPVVGDIASLPSLYESSGGFYDGMRTHMEQAGLGEYTGAVSLMEASHDLGGAAVGERSVLAQYVDGIDRGFANLDQTTSDISAAVGDRDAGGVVRALERSGFRQAEIALDTITANPLPGMVDAVGNASGHLGEAVTPFAPETAARLEHFEQVTETHLEQVEEAWQRATDAETWYDRRRSTVRMPWDPR